MKKLTKMPGSVLSDGLCWYDPQQVPELVFGLNWFGQERLYRRLPQDWPEPFPDSVEQLAWNTSGAQLRFLTDSRSLSLRVRLAGPPTFVHMAATGQSGFDCSIDEGQGPHYCSTSMYPDRAVDQTVRLFQLPDAQLRQVALRFPLYQGVEKLTIGIDPEASVFEPWPYPTDRRLVFYGTSITQGGCASRPGMSYTSLIGEALDISCLNLGFSGSGRGEPVMARLIASLDNLAMIVLDYEANAGFAGLRETLPAFLDILRLAHPAVPILMLSQIPFARDQFDAQQRQTRLASAAFQRKLVKDRRGEGDQNLYFLNGGRLLGRDADLCTVDGVHPTDLGFWRITRSLLPVIRRILAAGQAPV